MIAETAPAKINLTLDILHKRDDGYHELEMVMTTIDLSDRISLYERGDSLIHVESSSGFVPSGDRNLAYRAAMELRKRYGVARGVSIFIQKNIPVAAGLAGGSSDAAATLRGLNRLWDLGLSLDELAEIGQAIGSDVPFCVYGGTALATGRGERLKVLPVPPPCWVVLAKPPLSVSTREIFETLRIGEIAKRPSTDAMVRALSEQDYVAMCQSVGNVLEPVTMEMYPEVCVYKQKLQQFGADAVLMSGSGPTLYAFLKLETRVHRFVNALRGFCHNVYAVRLLGMSHDHRLRKTVQR